MFTFITHIEEKKNYSNKLFLPLTRIDFAVRISSRAAVHTSSRAAVVFPALSLRCVLQVLGNFFLLITYGFPRKLHAEPSVANDKFVNYIDMIVLLETHHS